MSPELSVVLRIQSLDLSISDLEKHISALPKRIAEIERALDSHKRRLEMDRAALSGNQKERKQLDGDILVQNQKIAKLRDQMLSAKTNEQYRAFQHEIEYCETEIRKYEDRILDLMTVSETLDQEVRKAEVALAAEVKLVEAEKTQARGAAQKMKQDLDAATRERTEASSSIRKDYLNNYERIRKNRAGIAVAEAVGGKCSACNMILRPQVMQELNMFGDSLHYCESCKRILYVNPPVDAGLTA